MNGPEQEILNNKLQVASICSVHYTAIFPSQLRIGLHYYQEENVRHMVQGEGSLCIRTFFLTTPDLECSGTSTNPKYNYNNAQASPCFVDSEPSIQWNGHIYN